ncbi:MAG: ribosome small subunit-dependent GTPase A [Gammaproteobacteria bacterium]|nr:ribosome small subunit-dependent GTPase A [Gammaproteobacteria bacterium]
MPAVENIYTGIVIARHGKEYLVEDTQGQRLRCIPRQQLAAIACGDKVRWQPQAQGYGTILALLPRQGELVTWSKTNTPKLLAANIQQVIIVSAAQPAPQIDMIDRYVVGCEIAAIKPVVVFNKVDLLTPPQRSAIESGFAAYADAGYPLFYLSAHHGTGIACLLNQIGRDTVVLVGPSGVGKSSVIRALVPHATTRVGELSAQQGRHTTSHSELYHLSTGGHIIDSPGVRSFQFPPASPATLAQAFIEFRPWLGQCRFQDCSHVHEPDCAIKAALSKQQISAQRYASYLAMRADQ